MEVKELFAKLPLNWKLEVTLIEDFSEDPKRILPVLKFTVISPTEKRADFAITHMAFTVTNARLTDQYLRNNLNKAIAELSK